MANTLLINKLTGGYFQFVLNGDTANAVRGIRNDLLAVGEQLHFKTGNGANIIKEQFIYPADLTIVASGTFTFTNVDQVWTKLIEIGYFDWINSGGSGTGASRFDDLLDTFKYTGKDGQVVIVNESQQKLQTVELYNYRTFTDLEDTPDLLLANKMVATNEAGNALIFKNLPEDPVNYLNSIGFFDYNDLATQTTPISVTANTDTKLTNDTLGAYTNINYPPYGVSSLWDATTNRFNFSQLSIGDTIDVRVHLQVTTTTSNQTYKIGAKFGIGSASAFDNIIFTDQAKTAGVHEVSFVAPFYIGEANILNNPAELYINTDASASVKVDGWYIRVLRRNINIVNVETGVDDATTTVKGILRLAGDLSGTATNPTVPALADKALKTTTITINGTTFDLSANREWTVSSNANWGGIGGVLSNQTDLQTVLDAKEPSIASGTTAQYWRGDKSWQTLDKTAVGLANVDNTSDANKPISTATQTALDAKQATLVSGTNIKTVNGVSLLGSGNLSIAGLSTGSLEFNDTDKTVWNNGKNDIADATSFGQFALRSNTGSKNNAFGTSALFSNDNGSDNSAFGNSSLSTNNSGSFNSAFGNGSLQYNNTGYQNSVLGFSALRENTTGYQNSALGVNAGWAIADGITGNTTGNNSIFLGYNTKALADNQTNQIVIGANAIGHGSNTVTLGNSSIVTTILRGNVGIGTDTPFSPSSSWRTMEIKGSTTSTITGFFARNSDNSAWFAFYMNPSAGATIGTTSAHRLQFVTQDIERIGVETNGNVKISNLGTGTVYSNAGFLTNINPSDERLKENIEDLGYGLNEILQLRPVSYNWINDTANQGTQFGFIAQEVQEIMPELINEFTITEDNEEVVRLGLDKEAIFVTLVNAIKELKAEIELLKQ